MTGGRVYNGDYQEASKQRELVGRSAEFSSMATTSRPRAMGFSSMASSFRPRGRATSQSHGRTLGEGAQRVVGVEQIRQDESHAKVRDAMALSSWFDWRWGWQNREATVFPRMICTFPENGL